MIICNLIISSDPIVFTKICFKIALIKIPLTLENLFKFKHLVGKNYQGHLVGYKNSSEQTRRPGKQFGGKKYKGILDLNATKGF